MHMNQLCLFLLSLFSASPYFRPSPHQTSSPNSRPVHLLDSNICNKLIELFFLFFLFVKVALRGEKLMGFPQKKGLNKKIEAIEKKGTRE